MSLPSHFKASPEVDEAVMTAYKKYLNGVNVPSKDVLTLLNSALERSSNGENADDVVQELSKPYRDAHEVLQKAKKKRDKPGKGVR